MSPKSRMKILATAIALMASINARAETSVGSNWDIYTLATENELSVLNGLLDRGLIKVNLEGKLELSQGLFTELEGLGVLENLDIRSDGACGHRKCGGSSPKPKN